MLAPNNALRYYGNLGSSPRSVSSSASGAYRLASNNIRAQDVASPPESQVALGLGWTASVSRRRGVLGTLREEEVVWVCGGGGRAAPLPRLPERSRRGEVLAKSEEEEQEDPEQDG